MSNRIPNELAVGDIIYHRRGVRLYEVVRFSTRNGETQVHLRSSSGRNLNRSMEQILKNWRL